MNLRQIDYFISVAKYLNFTAAAKSMFITQPCLSKQIALLEKEVGVQLIQRNKRTVRLTHAGNLLYREFEKIKDQFNESLWKVRRTGSGRGGSLSIGCLETVNMDMFFPELIMKFSTQYPGIKLSIESGGFKYLREKLQEDYFDIIFTISFDLENLQDLQIKNIHKRKGCIVFSKNNRIAQKSDFSFSRLSDEPFITFSKNESQGISSRALKTAATYDFANIKLVNNMSTLLSHLELGMGFSVLDRSIGENRKHNFIFHDLPEKEANFYAVCASRKESINPTVAHFMNMLQ